MDAPIIPLGNTCGIAYKLSKLGMRKHAYPFDWIKTDNFANIIMCIDADFKDFLEFTKSGISHNHPYMESNEFPDGNGENQEIQKSKTQVVKNKYNMKFYHDFKTFDDQEKKQVCEKYLRRINRFREVIKTSKQITFFWDENFMSASKLTKLCEQIEIFKESIKKCNPANNINIKFVLIIHNPKNEKLENNKKYGITIINDICEYGSWMRPNLIIPDLP